MTLSDAKAWGPIRFTIIVSVFTNLLMLTGPLFMLQVYDRVLASRSEETLVALFGLVTVLYLCFGILEYVRGRVLARAGARFQSAVQARVFEASIERAGHRSPEASGGQATGHLDAVNALTSSSVLLNVLDVPWTPLFIAAIFVFHPWLGWLALAGGGLLVVNALINQAVTKRAQARAQGASGASQRFNASARDGSEIIHGQGMLAGMRTRWTALRDEALRASLQAADRTGFFTAGSKAFRLFLQSAILALGAWLVLRGELTAGAMIAASILLSRALSPLEQVIAQWPFLQRGLAGWRALRTLLSDRTEPAAPTALPRPKASLNLSRVSVFKGLSDPPILQGIDLSLTPGQALGVIGRSGSGKTTLARLCVGVIEPAAGQVRLDGATYDQYGPDTLGKHIGYLPQDVRFFDGTIAENIAQMAETPDPARLVRAAQRARVHDIILKLPDGYETAISASDRMLSGGQRQRLALARALYNDPVLLVLDEPNSALDADGSEALNEVIRSMKAEGRWVIVMTHRPTAISACDTLMVLDGGRLAAYGPRDEVVKSMIKNASGVKSVMEQEARA